MDNIKYKVYISTMTDPRVNLSLEESFMSTVQDDECILLFWQSENAVVIGRNQNPYQECNLSKLEADNVITVRRLSGGGAVYHDLGNLNFAFISKTDYFDIDRQFSIILKALKKLDIDGEFNGRNDLITDGRKFSGNAFIHDEDRHLHHGTLLIDADMNKISEYLSVSHQKLDNKGFDSVKSRVVNLKEINKTITIDDVINHSVDSLKHFTKHTVKAEYIYEDTLPLNHYMDKYMSHEWNFGDGPAFDFQYEEKFPWGMFSIHMNVKNGLIEDLAMYTDALESEKFYNLITVLENQKLSQESLNFLIDDSILEPFVKSDLKGFFKHHLFS
ncbi:MAG: lipoate--protein ligase [Clostridiales bacterium]|nr:lipoate--protein ligase [Clostridiales bacterium]